MSDAKDCFVISPIGEEGSDIRERADKVLEYVITPPLESKGYNPIRADQISEPGIITSQVIDYVVECPLVIADLTGSNANVFYELAVRHAYQKPVIQIINSGENIPFDVASTRTIQVDIEDLESAEDAKRSIKEQIESIEKNTQEIANPISVATDLKNLRESTDPEERSMADIMETLTDLRNSVVSIQNSLEQPKEILPPEYIEDVINSEMDMKMDHVLYNIDTLEARVLDEVTSLDDSLHEDELESAVQAIKREFRRVEKEIGSKRTQHTLTDAFRKLGER